MQIKHYDTLKELFGANRATSKRATTAKERLQQWEREPIDLTDSFETMGMLDIEVNMGNDTPSSAVNLELFSPLYDQSNQTGGTSGSRGTERKAQMIDIVEAQYERVTQGIDTLAHAIKDGNCASKKLHEVVERQAAVAKKTSHSC